MATLKLTPTSGSIMQGGVFNPPTITAKDDNGVVISSPIVTGPVPAVDVNAIGPQALIYTLTTDNAGVAAVVNKTYTLTVTELPSSVDKFIDGSGDRFGRDVSGSTYESLVQTPPAGEVNAGLFDENSIDPYELANAKIN